MKHSHVTSGLNAFYFAGKVLKGGGVAKSQAWTYNYVWAKIQGGKHIILAALHLKVNVLIGLLGTTFLNDSTSIGVFTRVFMTLTFRKTDQMESPRELGKPAQVS